MKTAYIFHDAFSDPNNDWYPWMKTSLEAMGYFVVVPKFPTPAGQSYESWRSAIRNYTDKFDRETIFVGHGIGGTFALRTLEELSVHIHGVFLVASYTEALGHVGYDRVNETFINHTFDWGKIKNSVLTIKVFAGEGDPFVPTAQTENLAKSLGVNGVIIPEGGHINKASGFIQCVPLVQGIKEGLGEIDKSMVVEAGANVIEEPVFVRPADAAFPSDTNVSGESAPTEEKKTGSETTTNSTLGSHTMYQDMTKLVNSNEGRVASSLLTKARSDTEEKKISSPMSTSNSLYIIGTIFVILITISLGIFFLKKYSPVQKNTPDPVVTSLIQAESHARIDILEKPFYELSQAILTALQKQLVDDTFADIYYTRGALRASFVDVIDSLELGDNIPESLRNEFIPAGTSPAPVFMHINGLINNSSVHALILPVSRYDKAFSGMRAWEPTLLRDIGVFMNQRPETLRTRLSDDIFQDEMIVNRPLRVLRENNQFMLGYFFLNDRTLVIIDSTEIIPEILARYANRQIYP